MCSPARHHHSNRDFRVTLISEPWSRSISVNIIVSSRWQVINLQSALMPCLARWWTCSHSFRHNFDAVAQKCFIVAFFSASIKSIFAVWEGFNSFSPLRSHMTMTLAFLCLSLAHPFYNSETSLYTSAHRLSVLLIDYHFRKRHGKRHGNKRHKVGIDNLLFLDRLYRATIFGAIIHSNSSSRNISPISIARQLKTCLNSGFGSESEWSGEAGLGWLLVLESRTFKSEFSSPA